MRLVYNPIIDNYAKLHQYVCQYATLKIQLNQSLDDLKPFFPRAFCSTPSLVHPCVYDWPCLLFEKDALMAVRLFHDWLVLVKLHRQETRRG
jgi:hypothetical protein